MASNSRTYNSIVNSIWGIASSAITILLNFFVRIIFVRELGEEINGLNTLFYSITNVLLLMELGIGSAMIIHLYEPIKKNRQDEVLSILGYYRYLYRILAIVFLCGSIILDLFFLRSIITSTINFNTIRIFFILFIFSYVVNYLTYYKRSILFADQKNRIAAIVSTICEVVFRGIQLMIIIVYHSYYIFLILAIFEKLCINLICEAYVNKNYPYLKRTTFPIISQEKKTAIYSTIKPLMVSQVANSIQQSSQSILISYLLKNISMVGYFGNYYLLVSMVQLIYGQFGGAFTSSFGHLAVDNDSNRMRNAYLNSAFLLNWIACFFTVGFICCSNDFIYFVFGKSSVLNSGIVFIIALNMLIYLINIPIISIQNAMGLHKLDAKWMIVQAIVAIIFGFIGGKYWGMQGIFTGLLIPLVIFSTIRKGIIISQTALDLTAKDYLRFIAKQLLVIIFISFICRYICDHLFNTISIISLLSKASMCIILCIIIPSLFYYRTTEYTHTIRLIVKTINRRV